MSNYNLDRGQTLYYDELKKYCLKKPNFADEIMTLGSLFNKVGVMQEGPVSNFTFTESSLSYDFVPSYKRLANLVANACFVKSTSETEISQEELINLVFKNWDAKSLPINQIPEGVERKYLPNVAAKTEEEILNDSSYQEILDNSDAAFNLVEAEDLDGMAYDDIDLLEDLAEYLEEDEAFTVEGKRALGLVDSDYDSTELIGTDGQPVKKFKQEYQTGEVSIDDDGNYIIKCPYTGSSEVYQISTNLFASYETDQPFKVKLSLADTAE